MPYTRKYRNKAIGMQALHRILSRIDAEKDALHAQVRIALDHISYFHTCADRLFGEMPVQEYKQRSLELSLEATLQRSTQDFLNTLLRYKVYQPVHLAESDSFTDLQHRFKSLAPEIHEAVHDAGVSPRTYNPALRILLNPGSYLDPGHRTPVLETQDITGFHTPLTSEDFQYLGIPLQSFEATLRRDGGCTVQLQYKFTILHPSFSNKYVHELDAGHRFFDGNPTKNRWFNSGEKDDFVAEQFILYKELGDVLQAYYAAQRIARNMNQFRTCFFTNDTNAMYRCILLHVPACISKQCGKGHTQFHYHPAMSDIKLKWQRQHRDALVEHNQHAMSQINRVLQHGYYYTHTGQCIHFEKGSRLAQFLETCIRSIRDTTERFLSLAPETMSLQEYGTVAALFKASRLFNQSVANRAVLSLFVEPSASSHLFPKPFGDVLYSLQKGGFQFVSEEEWAPYIQDPEQVNYTLIDPDKSEEHLPIVYVLQGLFAAFQNRFPEKSLDQLRFLAEDVNGKLIQLLGVSGRPAWEPAFLDRLVEMYLSGELQSITHEAFQVIHGPVIEKAMDWEWKLLESHMPHRPTLSSLVAMVKAAPLSSSLGLLEPQYRPLVKARRFTRRKRNGYRN